MTKIVKFVGRPALTTIYYQTFHAMRYLTIIDLSNTSITSIPSNAFMNADANTVYLPSNMNTMKSNSIEDMRYLKKLVIYNSISTYSDGIIKNCLKLEKIYYFGTEDFTDKGIFSSMDTNKISVYVTEKYKGTNFGKARIVRMWYFNKQSCHFNMKFENKFIFNFVILDKN